MTSRSSQAETRVEVAVVGAGQAGLSASWHLADRDISHVVLEAGEIAHEWRDRRWDTFCLVTPNWQCDLPGFAYGDGFGGTDADGFMLRDEIVDFVRAYAASFDPPVREHTAVRRLAHAATDDGYELYTDGGMVIADQVVVAAGPYQKPRVPRLAEWLPADVHQLHSSEYQRPDDLPEGAVLVVGSGQSGAQVAEDLHLAGREVHLVTGSAPRVARTYRGRDVVAWLEDMGYYARGVDEFDDVDSVRFRVNHYVTGRDGGHDIDLRAFARDGMRLYGRLVSAQGPALTFRPDLTSNLDNADKVSEGIKDSVDSWIEEHAIEAPTEERYVPVWRSERDPESLDLGAAGIAGVVWATGYARDDTWIEVPVFDGRGYPTHRRGVTSAPGLYFLGLPWQHTWGSGRFGGVGADAGFVVDRIQEHSAEGHHRLRWISQATSHDRDDSVSTATVA
jgi:putative flavoprotein involved in K+ transport